MTFPTKTLLILACFILSCDTGNLKLVADIPNHLTEVSGTEHIKNSNLLWVIEDGGKGDKAYIYGLTKKGKIESKIHVLNAKNRDWEDLTSDKAGNIFIGDFGNNSKKRKSFYIYKLQNVVNAKDTISAEKINFTLPKNIKSRDFEAFFEFKNAFYIFSKDRKTGYIFKIPNKAGTHVAKVVSKFELKGKERRITSADISNDGKSVVLLNHDKAWLLTNFKDDDFFNGTIESLKFNHNSQKEGICFKNDSTFFITDERNGAFGGNIYSLEIKTKTKRKT